jgi:hypothetical protein
MVDKGRKTIKAVCSTNGAETIGHPRAKKNESRYRPYILHENKLIKDQRLKCKVQNYKTPR